MSTNALTNILSASYWGTLDDIVTVPDAHFGAMIIVGSTIYGLILTEVGIASTDPSVFRMTTVQKGILKRSLLVTLALFFHGITTTGYVQDQNGHLQAVTSVFMVCDLSVSTPMKTTYRDRIVHAYSAYVSLESNGWIFRSEYASGSRDQSQTLTCFIHRHSSCSSFTPHTAKVMCSIGSCGQITRRRKKQSQCH